MDLFSYPDRLHPVEPARKRRVLSFLMAVIDILTIALTFQIDFYLNYHGGPGLFITDRSLLIIFLISLPVLFFMIFLIKTTRIPVKHIRKLLIIYLNSALISFTLIILINFFAGMKGVPRLFLIELPFLCFTLLLIVRIIKQNILFLGGVKDYKYINVVAVADESSLPVLDEFMVKHRSRYKTEVIFTDSQALRSQYEKSVIVLSEKYSGIIDDLIDINMIDEILYLKSKPAPEEFRQILRSCEESGVTLRLLRRPEDEKSLSSGINHSINNKQFLSFLNIPVKSFSQAIRKTTDQVFASWLIMGLLPIFILLCLVLLLFNKGPLFVSIEKTGLRGHHFHLFKFFTGMKETADTGDEEYTRFTERFQATDRKRSGITRLHRFIYLSGLEDLPMLFNVLKGDIPLISSGRRFDVRNVNIN